MSAVSVNNLDEIKLHLRKELGGLADRLDKSMKANTQGLSSLDIMRMQTLVESLKDIARVYDELFKKLELNPTINVTTPSIRIPEIKIPEIKVPDIHLPQIKAPDVHISPPVVNVQASEVIIDLERLVRALEPLTLLSDKADSPISVRLSDGKRFIEALKQVSNASDKMVQVFSSAQPGLTSDEYREVLKSSADVTSVNDSDSSQTLLAANNNRKGFIIFNDSTAILYVKLGATASTTSFTYRLTPYGTVSETNFRYTGVIDGIWASNASGAARITNLT